MSFDLETQHSCVLPGGGKADYGKYSFCANADIVDVPVRIQELASWWTSPEANSNGLNLYTNGVSAYGDISNGYISFRRQTMRSDLSQSFFYELKGY